MKKLLVIAAVALAMSCRSPYIVWDEETQTYMTEAEKKALDEERGSGTVTVTIIIQ